MTLAPVCGLPFVPGRKKFAPTLQRENLLGPIMASLSHRRFETVFVPEAKQLPGRTILIGDNLSCHFSESVLRQSATQDISFICLPPNSTHILQPLDVAFYGPLKRYWRQILDEWKMSSAKRSITLTKDMLPRLLNKLYNKLYEDDTETSENLVSGFRKCGIHPLNSEEVLKRLPDGVQGSRATLTHRRMFLMQ